MTGGEEFLDMSNNNENTKLRNSGRMIDDLEFLERLEAGLVTGEERLRFANELMADEDGRERYLAMCELGLFGEEAKAEAKPKVVANVKDATAPSGKSPKSALSRAIPWVASCAVLVIVAGIYFNPNPTNQPDPSFSSSPFPMSPPTLPSIEVGKLPAVLVHPHSPSAPMGGGARGLNNISGGNEASKQVDPDKLQNSESNQALFDFAVDALTPEEGTNHTNSAAAWDALEKCDELAQRSGDGLLLKGLINSSSAKWDKAAECFRQAVEEFEKMNVDALKLDEARFNLAFALWQQGRLKDAKDVYGEVSSEYREKLRELGKNAPAVRDTLKDLDADLK